MIMFVEQLEQHLLYRDEKDIPTDSDEAGEPIDFCETTSLESKLVREISQELDGKYYSIMYGKRCGN